MAPHEGESEPTALKRPLSSAGGSRRTQKDRNATLLPSAENATVPSERNAALEGELATLRADARRAHIHFLLLVHGFGLDPIALLREIGDERLGRPPRA